MAHTRISFVKSQGHSWFLFLSFISHFIQENIRTTVICPTSQQPLVTEVKIVNIITNNYESHILYKIKPCTKQSWIKHNILYWKWPSICACDFQKKLIDMQMLFVHNIHIIEIHINPIDFYILFATRLFWPYKCIFIF